VALSRKDPPTGQLGGDKVAAPTGETLTLAVRAVLVERLAADQRCPGRFSGLPRRLHDIGKRCAHLPDHASRSPAEIFGCRESGMWR
jgi:hypothetical protein